MCKTVYFSIFDILQCVPWELNLNWKCIINYPFWEIPVSVCQQLVRTENVSESLLFLTQLHSYKILNEGIYASRKKSLKTSVSYKPIALHKDLANIQVIYN